MPNAVDGLRQVMLLDSGSLILTPINPDGLLENV